MSGIVLGRAVAMTAMTTVAKASLSEREADRGLRLSWPAHPLVSRAQGAPASSVSAPRQPRMAPLPMMAGWTLPTPRSIPSLPT
ncbi:hypothetical protein CDN99_00510 [Roseateles aquatilis]|uniref:Uncharacterized protein n=1 Tax=Roseateles aquatilis TaxID=431061 RepID=A0A246JK54_9BURK|nr:hypothetical protein [Roseateles aquatilis]OWQ93026.1 hypothetical protein CDN99_00510 [Roseateles aquatilis]